ncbi:MAG TPA: hypothetical protein VK416_13845, partial [Thermoanaerobaculia bacterium]|nr:hypothetical protein [Thermoanaerobaculia bacterium]
MKVRRYFAVRLFARPKLLLVGLIVVALFTAHGRAVAQRSPRLERSPRLVRFSSIGLVQSNSAASPNNTATSLS